MSVVSSPTAKIRRVVTRDAAGNVISDSSATPAIIPAVPRPPGLGDLIATFAQPIAGVIDRFTESMLSEEHKTALQSCSACARRHNKLNLLCPDIRTCPFLGKLLAALPSVVSKALFDAASERMHSS